MSNPLLPLLWYWGSSVLLAALLFFPVSKFLWVLRVRGLERRLGRRGTEEEREAERRRARIWAALIAVTFAFLYNRFLFPPA